MASPTVNVSNTLWQAAEHDIAVDLISAKQLPSQDAPARTGMPVIHDRAWLVQTPGSAQTLQIIMLFSIIRINKRDIYKLCFAAVLVNKKERKW